MDEETKENIEAQFWRVYCECVWNRVKSLANEACYGCSHRTPYEKDHTVSSESNASDNRRISRFVLAISRR